MKRLSIAHRLIIGSLVIVAMLLAGLPAATVPVASAAGSIHLSQSLAGSGDVVTVTGAGFHADDSVVLRIDFTAPGGRHRIQTTATVNGAGAFQTAFTVPDDALPGIYAVKAQDLHTTVASQSLHVLRVVLLQPGAKAQTVPIRAGHTFLVRGKGFVPGDSVHLTVTYPLYSGNSFTAKKTVRADTHGAFNDVQLTVPAGAKAGVATLDASGTPKASKAGANVNVYYAPTISLSAAAARPGGSISVLGAGFVPGGTVKLSVALNRSDGTTITLTRSAQVDAAGAFTSALPVPSSANPGTYTVTAVGNVAGFHTSTALKVSVQPAIAVNPSAVYPGGTFTVHGAGFSANVPLAMTVSVPLYAGGSRTLTENVQTDEHGNFTKQLALPANAAAGSITVAVKGPHAGATVRVLVQHLAGSVSVSPASIIPGSTVTIRGKGYLAGDTIAIDLHVALNNGTANILTTTAGTDAHGTFVASLRIPSNVASGLYTVVARSTKSGRAPTTRLTVARLSSHLTVAPGAVYPGGSVSVTGAGFSAGVTVSISAAIPLYGGGTRTITATGHTNAGGQFSAQLAVPANAAAQQVTITAQGPNTRAGGQFFIRHLGATVQSTSAYASPGTTVTVTGNGYLPSDRIAVSMVVKLSDGSSRTLTAAAVTDKNGHFTTGLSLPATSVGGTYTIVARSTSSGRAPTAKLVVAQLAPSIVAVPVSTAPGSTVTVNGFGFAPGQTVTISLSGQKAGSATSNSSGKFTTAITIPNGLATGQYDITAVSGAGRHATFRLAIQRQVSTHFYFASFYTGNGYHEYLNLLNPSNTEARVTISYQPTVGGVRSKSLTVAAHTRFTEDVNADLGVHVSAGAVVSADVPIAVERLVQHGTDFTGGPGTPSPSTTWYFANGNTGHQYREYLAIENPNNGPVQVAVHFFPTHHRATTLYRTVAATSRTTVKVNTYVNRDAVGVSVTSNGPVVVNRTMYVRHGITSKIGVKAPQRSWYFAGGPANPSAHHWIGVINPSAHSVSLTLNTYSVSGQGLGTVHATLRPFGRAGFLINKIAHTTNAAVVLTALGPIVAEQTTYVGRMHDAATDTFGVYAPARTWEFATASTLAGHSDTLILFNPALVPIPVVVQFISSAGKVSEQTYVVGPLSQQRIDVGSVVPNTQLGMVVASNSPVVALNRAFANNHRGSETSSGVRP